MWDNKLYDDTMTVGIRSRNSKRSEFHILPAVAKHDHIVPYDAAKHLIANGQFDRQGSEGRSRLASPPDPTQSDAVAKKSILARQKINMTDSVSI